MTARMVGPVRRTDRGRPRRDTPINESRRLQMAQRRPSTSTRIILRGRQHSCSGRIRWSS